MAPEVTREGILPVGNASGEALVAIVAAAHQPDVQGSPDELLDLALPMAAS
jgi:hypothetical protein